MEIVEITTQQGDNAHRIFQSLNGTGVKLNQADLLRNYLFMLLPTRGDEVYKSIWRPMEELIGVDNLEGLARVDLQRRGLDVPRDEVYARHQQRIDPVSYGEEQVEAEVRDLALRRWAIIGPGALSSPRSRAARRSLRGFAARGR